MSGGGITRAMAIVAVLLMSGIAAAQSPAPPRSSAPATQGKRDAARSQGKPAAPAPRPAGEPIVRTWVDRTAMWLGDHVTYTIEVALPRGFDVLDDDVSKDKIRFEGLDVIGTDTSRVDAPDGRATRRFRYILTAYRVDAPALKIAPPPVRYYARRAGERLEDAAPAGAVPIPETVVALRSMLPEDQATYALRDERAPMARPAVFALAQPVGLALIVASIVPVVIAALAFAGRGRRRESRRSGRQVRRAERASLEAVRATDLSTPEGRRDAYTHIDTIVREHLRDVGGVAGLSLTPAEVPAALAERPSRVPAETVASLLAECETARYGPPAALPSADACRAALAQAEQVLAARR